MNLIARSQSRQNIHPLDGRVERFVKQNVKLQLLAFVFVAAIAQLLPLFLVLPLVAGAAVLYLLNLPCLALLSWRQLHKTTGAWVRHRLMSSVLITLLPLAYWWWLRYVYIPQLRLF